MISKKAAAQGEREWFKKIKSIPAKLKELVASYRTAVQSAAKAGNKRANWSIATYKEEVKGASKLRNVDSGQLMWQEQAIDFWQSLPGG